MKKPIITQTILCLIIGLLPLTGYYFLMTEYFKVSPFEGYYWIPTIYLIICYVLYPSAVGKLSDSTFEKTSTEFISAKTIMMLSFIFAPFILIFKRNK